MSKNVPASNMLQLLMFSMIFGFRTVDILQTWLISLENNQQINKNKNGRWLRGGGLDIVPTQSVRP